MTNFTIYGTPVCPACNNAKEFLKNLGKTFTYVDVTQDKEKQAAVVEYWREQGRRPTVPLVYDNEKTQYVGNYEQLTQYFNQ